jgi:hypothetical protein
MVRRTTVSPNKVVSVGVWAMQAIEPFLACLGGEGEGQGHERCVAARLLPTGHGGEGEWRSRVWWSSTPARSYVWPLLVWAVGAELRDMHV